MTQVRSQQTSYRRPGSKCCRLCPSFGLHAAVSSALWYPNSHGSICPGSCDHVPVKLYFPPGRFWRSREVQDFRGVWGSRGLVCALPLVLHARESTWAADSLSLTLRRKVSKSLNQSSSSLSHHVKSCPLVLMF